MTDTRKNRFFLNPQFNNSPSTSLHNQCFPEITRVHDNVNMNYSDTVTENVQFKEDGLAAVAMSSSPPCNVQVHSVKRQLSELAFTTSRVDRYGLHSTPVLIDSASKQNNKVLFLKADGRIMEGSNRHLRFSLPRLRNQIRKGMSFTANVVGGAMVGPQLRGVPAAPRTSKITLDIPDDTFQAQPHVSARKNYQSKKTMYEFFNNTNLPPFENAKSVWFRKFFETLTQSRFSPRLNGNADHLDTSSLIKSLSTSHIDSYHDDGDVDDDERQSLLPPKSQYDEYAGIDTLKINPEVQKHGPKAAHSSSSTDEGDNGFHNRYRIGYHAKVGTMANNILRPSVSNVSINLTHKLRPKGTIITKDRENYLIGSTYTHLLEPMMQVNRLALMSFNAGLLEYQLGGITCYRNPPFTSRRLHQIAPALSHADCDIIALQEVYEDWQADYLMESLEAVFPFVARRTSGGLFSLHNGLMIFSKYPIIRTAFHPFSSVTAIERLFGSKGMLEATIDIPTIGEVTLVNIHLASGAVDPESSSLEALRNRELEEVFHICSTAIDRGEVPIIIGDLNAAPNLCPTNYRKICEMGWRDTFALAMQQQRKRQISSKILISRQAKSFKCEKSLPIHYKNNNNNIKMLLPKIKKKLKLTTFPSKHMRQNNIQQPRHAFRRVANACRIPLKQKNTKQTKMSFIYKDNTCIYPQQQKFLKQLSKKSNNIKSHTKYDGMLGISTCDMSSTTTTATRKMSSGLSDKDDHYNNISLDDTIDFTYDSTKENDLLKTVNNESSHNDDLIGSVFIMPRDSDMMTPLCTKKDSSLESNAKELSILPLKSMCENHHHVSSTPGSMMYKINNGQYKNIESFLYEKSLIRSSSIQGTYNPPINEIQVSRSSNLNDSLSSWNCFAKNQIKNTGNQAKDVTRKVTTFVKEAAASFLKHHEFQDDINDIYNDDEDPYYTKCFTWDPKNPLNMIGPHSECHGLRCDHVFLPPEIHANNLAQFRPFTACIMFTEPRVIVEGCCCGLLGEQASLVTLSDHYAVRVELRRLSSK